MFFDIKSYVFTTCWTLSKSYRLIKSQRQDSRSKRALDLSVSSSFWSFILPLRLYQSVAFWQRSASCKYITFYVEKHALYLLFYLNFWKICLKFIKTMKETGHNFSVIAQGILSGWELSGLNPHSELSFKFSWTPDTVW